MEQPLAVAGEVTIPLLPDHLSSWPSVPVSATSWRQGGPRGSSALPRGSSYSHDVPRGWHSPLVMGQVAAAESLLP